MWQILKSLHHISNRQLQAEGHLYMSFKQSLVSKLVTNYLTSFKPIPKLYTML